MSDNTATLTESLGKRLEALKHLSAELLESPRTVSALELEKISEYIVSEELLCDEIRCFDRHLEILRERFQRCSAATPGDPVEGIELADYLAFFEPGSQEKVHRLVGELKHLQAGLRRLNRMQGELLRRSRRSVNNLINLTGHFMGSDDSPLAHAPEYADTAVRK